MIFNETEWINITNYLIIQINEYCAKKALDKEDFAKRLGISVRSLARLYSKKAITTEVRNNKLLSSLELIYSLAEALEIDVTKMFSEINLYANAGDKNKIKNKSNNVK